MSSQIEAQPEQLEDGLFKVQEYTTEGGRVAARITSVKEVNRDSSSKKHKLRIDGELPSGEEFYEYMPYPEADSAEYKFVRLCNEAGIPLAGVRQLEGTELEAKRNSDEDWEFHAPTRTNQALYRLMSVLSNSAVQTLLMLTMTFVVLAGMLSMMGTVESGNIVRMLNIGALTLFFELLCGAAISAGRAYDA